MHQTMLLGDDNKLLFCFSPLNTEFCANLIQQDSFGADVLRLWVSSVDYTNDVLIGSTVLRQMSDVYRKIRGTLRFLLGNLHDWKVSNIDSLIFLVLHQECCLVT